MTEVKALAITGTEQKEITYTASDGSEIRLTPEMVRKYLVQGHGEMVTIQEMVYFLNVCRSRKLNPFIRDCYLVKYSANDPAAVVTSIDYFRKRARAQKDCKGWKSGIIVKDSKCVKDTNGLLQDGEVLLGGWFEAKPDGWTDPLRIEVNLRGYIKKTKEGNVTRFWSPENQPSQIMKVAESQGLRKLWPDDFCGIYSEEEIIRENWEQVIDITTDENSNLIAFLAEFNRVTADKTLMPKYLEIAAKHFKKSVDEIKIEAIKDLPGFLAAYEKWEKAQSQKEEKVKKPRTGSSPQDDVLVDNDMAPGHCPKREDRTIMAKKFCDLCVERQGCPIWPGK